MTDSLAKEERSHQMSLIRSVNTKPEKMIRTLVYKMGFRYRLHAKHILGKPDLVFPRLNKIIFVHGCFWHRHRKPSCPLARMPKSRVAFWEAKLEGNRSRDLKIKRQLRSEGWRVLEVWECEIRDVETLMERLRYFLDNEIT